MNRRKQIDRTIRAAVILAGGEGTRLQELTRRITGLQVPKQFCPLIGSTTLLDQTRDRVSLTFQSDKIFLLLTHTQERFYADPLLNSPTENLVVQPENRGTLNGIVYAPLRLAARYPSASVAIFPSDHFVDDDVEFMRHVEMAFEAAEARPELTLLLGITPDSPEIGYGWIEPGQRLHLGKDPIFRVRRFWEEPSRTAAEALLARGCLWNSFVVVAKVSTLLDLTKASVPALYSFFEDVRPSLRTFSEEKTLRALYARLSTASFSEQVLATSPGSLAVLPVRDVQWTDLGEPQRVMKILRQIGRRPRWAFP